MIHLLLKTNNLPKLAWLTLELYNIKDKIDMFKDIIASVVKINNHFNKKSVQYHKTLYQ